MTQVDIFPKKQKTKNHIKKCSTSLTIRERQIKATMGYQVTFNAKAITKTTDKC
jgi:hypothetical protein